MITYNLILSGRVQGVGMRFFIKNTANKYNVVGYVKNTYDGKVNCIIQGEEKILENFIEYVKSNSPGHINHIDKAIINSDNTYTKFGIKIF